MAEKTIKRNFVIEIDYQKCIGCRACEVACSIKHEEKIWPEASRIRIYQFDPGPVDFPVLCTQCDDYPCAEACPPKVKAMTVNPETHALNVDEEKCLGIKCGRCAKACRMQSAINFHPVTKKAIVCDLCGGDPSCVKACPKDAIQIVAGALFDPKHTAYAPVKVQAADLRLKWFGKHVE